MCAHGKLHSSADDVDLGFVGLAGESPFLSSLSFFLGSLFLFRLWLERGRARENQLGQEENNDEPEEHKTLHDKVERQEREEKVHRAPRARRKRRGDALHGSHPVVEDALSRQGGARETTNAMHGPRVLKKCMPPAHRPPCCAWGWGEQEGHGSGQA